MKPLAFTTIFLWQKDHKGFHDDLLQLDIPYLLSYDPEEEIRQMYSHNGRGPKRIDLLYTAGSTNQKTCARVGDHHPG